ncbi:MAG: hypothetical protein Q8Q02_03955 [Nocardioides sp.]|nr:hypothetical protein [Nocardioides sp.]
METIVLLLLIAAGVTAYLVHRNQQRAATAARELEEVRIVVQEDVVRFGDELRELDDETLTTTLDTAMRQDYRRALDSFEAANATLDRLARTEDARHVTEALEDGRYAAACVFARRDGLPLPTRRPPCFFNPAHGPSGQDVEWAPYNGVPRSVPVCAADAERVRQGAEPDVRMVPQGNGRVPYWQAGPAFSPYAGGFFGAYAMSGMLPSFLMLGLLSSAGTGYDPAMEAGGADPQMDGDMGAGDGGSDFGGMDFGGGGDFGF